MATVMVFTRGILSKVLNAGPEIRDSGPGSRAYHSEVPLPQHEHVMPLVAGEDIGEGSHGDGVLACDALAEPCFRGHVAEHEDVPSTNVLELVDQVGKRACVERSVLDVGILLEARQW